MALKGSRVKVCFYTDDYAPGMVQVELVNKRLRRKVVRYVRANGGPNEETALLSHEDAESILSPRECRRLNEWDSVTVLMDDYEAFTLYGYDARNLSSRG